MLNLIVSLPLLFVVARMLANRSRTVRGTTLDHPWIWMVLALTVWVLAQVANLEPLGLPPGWRSRIGFFAFTLLLAPFVSVLGAKRPNSRAWDWFVVIPMLVVINWPVITSGVFGSSQQLVDLEAPALMGAIVVLVMILGNYFGTVHTPLVILLGTALLIGLTEFSQILPRFAEAADASRVVVSAGLLITLCLAPRLLARQMPHRTGYLRVWLDFRDWFGILWTKRLMDRLNQTAAAKQWPVRFGLDAIHEEAKSSDPANRDAEIDHALRWLLRRFTDDHWIDQRLKIPATFENTRDSPD
jgi:hypothetical protein